MKHAAPAILALLASTLPVLAQPPAPPRACLQVGRVYDFQPNRDNRSLIVTDSLRKKYKVTLLGICPDLKYRLSLGFHSRGTGSLQCLAPGDEVVMRREAGIGGRCPIKSIEYYTPEMEKADAAAKAKP